MVREHAGVATLFDTASGRRLRVFTLSGGETMSQATFSPDGRTLAVAVANTAGNALVAGSVIGSVALFDVDTHARETLTVSSSTSGPSTYPGVAYIDGGRRIVTLRDAETGGGSLQIWDPKARRLVGEPVEVPAGTTGLDASPDGSRVVFGTDAGYARRVGSRSRALVRACMQHRRTSTDTGRVAPLCSRPALRPRLQRVADVDQSAASVMATLACCDVRTELWFTCGAIQGECWGDR